MGFATIFATRQASGTTFEYDVRLPGSLGINPAALDILSICVLAYVEIPESALVELTAPRKKGVVFAPKVGSTSCPSG
jgi:hypothetical protein